MRCLVGYGVKNWNVNGCRLSFVVSHSTNQRFPHRPLAREIHFMATPRPVHTRNLLYSSTSPSTLLKSPTPRYYSTNPSNVWKDLMSDMQLLCKLPNDSYDKFISRFFVFKIKQETKNFKELDEIASLVTDVRLILMDLVDAYDLEVALSCLSKHCLNLSVSTLSQARNKLLFEELRTEFSSDKKDALNETTQTTAERTQSPTSGLKQSELSSIVSDLRTDQLKEAVENETNVQQEKNSYLEFWNKEKSDIMPFSFNPSKQFEMPKAPKATPQAKKEKEPNPEPEHDGKTSRPFLDEQFIFILKALQKSKYRVPLAASSLNMSPRQLHKMINLLTKLGYNFGLPDDFQIYDGFSHESSADRRNLKMASDFKDQRKKFYKVLTGYPYEQKVK